jgi:Holliday junction resolvase RusA-like endonuclease
MTVLYDEGLRFTVKGVPRPQGSMTAVRSNSTGRTFMKYSDPTRKWRAMVLEEALAAVRAVGWERTDGPVFLDVVFYFERPKSMPKWRRAHHEKINGPDLDKLLRAIGDALTDAGVYDDDRQITAVRASKMYDDSPRAEILVYTGTFEG